MGTLINPQRPSPQSEADFNVEPMYLRNPNTGIVFKLFHKDSITRCLREGYMPSTEAAMREQSIELAELQGHVLPSVATKSADPESPEPVIAPVDDLRAVRPARSGR